MLGGNGPPFTFHGSGDRRRRPVVHHGHLEDGRKTIHMQFWIRGSNAPSDGKEGRVYLQVIENEDGSWQDYYLKVDVPGKTPNHGSFRFLGHPTRILVQPVTQKPKPQRGWNPFSRWF